MYACKNGHTKVVAMLLENKANMEATDEVKIIVVRRVDFDETTVDVVCAARLTSCLLCRYINIGWVDSIDVRLRQRSH
jgi:hypothetical protein